jgi:lipid-binding SYLF domain-containing protein
MAISKAILLTTLVAMLAFVAGCTATTGGNNPDARRASIDAGVDDALASLFQQVEGSRELTSQARGVLVFPEVLEAGFIFAGSRGQGALRVGGQTSSYHATTSGSFGLQAGAQSTAVFMLFMTEEALRRFQNSNGWTAGVDASVTVLTVGASAQVTTNTAHQPVVGYVLSNRGLMAGISLDGARVTNLNL